MESDTETDAQRDWVVFITGILKTHLNKAVIILL